MTQAQYRWTTDQLPSVRSWRSLEVWIHRLLLRKCRWTQRSCGQYWNFVKTGQPPEQIIAILRGDVPKATD